MGRGTSHHRRGLPVGRADLGPRRGRQRALPLALPRRAHRHPRPGTRSAGRRGGGCARLPKQIQAVGDVSTALTQRGAGRDADGVRLIEMLSEPRESVPIVVPKRRQRPAQAAAHAPEPGPLEAQARSLQLTAVEPTEEEAPTESRVHTEIQAKLRDIGLFEGFDVWIADRGLVWDDQPLGTNCLSELPLVAAERTREVMKNIDVIWFRRGTGHPVRFFEIEHTTSVYSGLLRFNDVMIDFPITEAFIVGDGDKTERKFEREIARRTFGHSGLIDVTRFLLYDQVRQTWQRYQSVGAGSKAWGASLSPASQKPA